MTEPIKLPPEFHSGNSIPVERATITRERMVEILTEAIEADRQARGEPVAWLRNERDGYEGKAIFDPLVILGSAPPIKTANGATYSPVFSGPQPQQQASEPLFWYRPIADGMYEGPVHNNSVGGKMLRDEKPGEWKPLYGAPQPLQIPEGYRLCLIPKEGTPAFNAACSVAYQESISGTGPCGVFIAGLRAMLEAAPKPRTDK